MYRALTIARIVQICRMHNATPRYYRTSVGTHCMITDRAGRRVTSGYVRF